jgi:3-dehydroquinate synthase
MDDLNMRDPAALAYAVTRSCENKAAVVGADERESGERALLNLVHTFGHAIEAGLGFGTWLHGEAVAAGTVLAARLSERMGLLSANDVERIARLFVRAGLPIEPPSLGRDRYLELMGHDKKVDNGRLRLVLLKSLGNAFLTSDFNSLDLRAVLDGAVAHA